ncbi:MAG: response regulator transcription factor [Reyranella sp.]|jgi:DNA-binding response OmpR family regulator/DNA-binding CsgD family transcriptional regulator|nr:response regulator transcription factor [Reyranella sp.]
MRPDPKKRNVALVVDDSPETLRLLTDALDSAGLTVMVALDGLAAIRIVEQVTPDVILLDAVMPGIDGFETCERLKRNAALSNVPIIFMTGLSETEHIVRGLEVGGVDYVAKPIAIDEMLARIRVHLANAHLANSARAALDVAGRFLLAVNEEGKLIWATPQTHKFLAGRETGDSQQTFALSSAQMQWLTQISRGDREVSPIKSQFRDERVILNYMGQLGPGEILLRLTIDTPSTSQVELRKSLGLTARESEVLSWLSKGKTNRDIAQILGLSPRTIDKHLEQIYAKLGVENRTSAAAVAAKILGATQPLDD